jgi:hypothetical protein
MLALLAESALRSLLLGAAVWLGLKLLRVRNPHVQMTAWTLVLVASLAMPALMRLVTVTLPDAPVAPLAHIMWPEQPAAPPVLEPVPQPQLPSRAPAAMPDAGPPPSARVEPAVRPVVDWRNLATALYLLIGGVLLLRLIAGLALTWRLVRAAKPVRARWAAGVDVRVSDVVGVPVTFGSTILLPTEYVGWSAAKRRAVLIHEAAHVAHGDFFVLLLAAINRAVFWFNPFAWWQFGHLAELAEIISDDAALEALEDRPRYAGILLDVATRRQRALAALAMARPSTVRRRVERILSAHTLPPRPTWRRRMLVAAALLPVVALCAVTIAHGTTATTLPAAAMPQHAGDPSLDRYVGSYQLNAWRVFTIAHDGDGLSAQVTGQPRSRLARASDSDYAYEPTGARIAFTVDGEQPAPALILRQNRGGDRRAERVDATKARAIEERFARWFASAPERFRNQTPSPGSKEAVLGLVQELQRGASDHARMNPFVAETLRPQAANLQATLTAFGAVESAFFRGVSAGGYDIYGVTFANGSAEFRMLLAMDGIIDDVLFRPNGDNTQGNVVDCAQEANLRPSPGGAPIKLNLFNESGAVIRVFSLDHAGARTSRTTIEDTRDGAILTRVGTPVIVADAAGQCREIVMPGAQTRFVQVQAGAGPHGPLPPRASPLPNSEETLLRYIDELGRGMPDYSRMTPDIAAATRRNLALDRAILAQLGPVRSIYFRAVSWSGVDVYTVQFANGSADWRIGLVSDGRIGRLALGPQY